MWGTAMTGTNSESGSGWEIQMKDTTGGKMKYGREVNYAERGPLLSARCPDCSVTQAICRVSSLRLLQVLLVSILPAGAGDVVPGTGIILVAVSGEIASQSDRLDIGSFGAFRACANFERYALVFSQALEAARLDVLKVSEQIIATCIRSDKAEALGVIEPFDDTSLSSHVTSL